MRFVAHNRRQVATLAILWVAGNDVPSTLFARADQVIE
jgi:hypothetical protein